LWTANVEVDTGYYLGYYSYLDKDQNIKFSYVPKNHHFLKKIPVSEELTTLKRISEGFFTIEKKEQNYVFNDLRFGVLGIKSNKSSDNFVFSYELKTFKNTLIISEKKNKMREGKKIMKQVWKRMLGK